MVSDLDPGRVGPALFLHGPKVPEASYLLDRNARLALAFTVAAGVLLRHHEGEVDEYGTPRARDVPVGAVVLDLATGHVYTGFPQDRELGDPTAHAEVQAMRNATAAAVDLRQSLVTTTFEPCPGCLGAMADNGVPHVEYATGRSAVEDLGLIKAHADGAVELVARGRAPGLPPYPELLRVTDPVWQAAGVLPWQSFRRNPTTEAVTYSPYSGTQQVLDYHTRVTSELGVTHSHADALQRAAAHIAQLVGHGIES